MDSTSNSYAGRIIDRMDHPHAVTKREGNTLKKFEDFCTEKDSGQGQNMVFTGFFISIHLTSVCGPIWSNAPSRLKRERCFIEEVDVGGTRQNSDDR